MGRKRHRELQIVERELSTEEVEALKLKKASPKPQKTGDDKLRAVKDRLQKLTLEIQEIYNQYPQLDPKRQR